MEDVADSDSSSLPDSTDDETLPTGRNSLRLPGAMPLEPRTDHIDEATRKKIKKGQYINLRLLVGLKKKINRSISLGQAPSTSEEVEDSNLPIMQWVDAFIVFISVHIRTRPNDIQGMLRHLQIVKKMCAQGKNGVEYDTQFRRLRAQQPDIQWGEYLPELAADVEMESQKAYRPRKTFGYYKNQNKFHRLPSQRCTGVCYRFNLPEG